MVLYRGLGHNKFTSIMWGSTRLGYLALIGESRRPTNDNISFGYMIRSVLSR